jgi:signal transduction histidine kinase
MAARPVGAPPLREEDVDALRKLASFAAIAIDNAQLYHAQMEAAQALRAKSDELERAYAELRESQDRLLVSEKMAALGRLTAGIAHEINSPLGSVLNCLQLSQSYAAEYRDSIRDDEVTADDHEAIARDLLETLELAEGATRKVAEFVRTIKGQTRMHDEVVRAFRPAEEIGSVVALLQHTLRSTGVEVRVEVDPALEMVGDPGKFAVVIQNLVSNAVDAYEKGRGEVVVRMVDRGDARVLEVEDRGCGIPEGIRGRIFDYLFTTKDVGQGTGLGLSMVHSIVSTHFGGAVDLRSEVGAGTTFVVTFPATHGND